MKKKSFNSLNTEMPINVNFNNSRKILPFESRVQNDSLLNC